VSQCTYETCIDALKTQCRHVIYNFPLKIGWSRTSALEGGHSSRTATRRVDLAVPSSDMVHDG